MATTALRPGPQFVIQVRNLSKSYRRATAVREVSFVVERGEVFGLLGPDGAGKSSIIQMLTGVLTPSSGEAQVAGWDIVADPEPVKAQIGYMPQGLGLNLYDALTVEENIDFFGDLRQVPPEILRRNKAELLKITRLEPFRQRPAAQLSGGMRQKLALCCTLVHLPELIFLDEPTTGVDPLSRRDFWMIINRLVVEHGTTVLLTTSYLDEAERCHRVALLYQGRIIAHGRPADLQAQADVDSQGRSRSLEEVFIQALERETGEPAPPPPAIPSPVGISFAEVAAVRVEGLTKKFGAFTAVDRVSFQVRPGEIFGFLGPNGAGKTTLIKMLTGILPPSGGQAWIAGHELGTYRQKIKLQLGYMSQKFSLYRDLTVLENLQLYGGIYRMSAAELHSRIPQILAMTDLEGREDELAGGLPLGIRQRLALGCAILHRPRLVFLDEPTSGVDPLARRKFWQIISELAADGVTVLVSTHYMDEAQHCQRLALMHQGRLVAVGTPEELRGRAEAGLGRLLEVETQDFRQAMMVVQKEFSQAFLHGSRIHIPTREPEADRQRIQKLLAQAGLPLDQVLEIPLSMEDTFIYFIQSAGQEDNSAF
ncbi:MAG: ABC transporter ATP-binding protein [Deltaproteobacteria bacterium]|nr:ABC transporter ATP-binding protein [Deltaproteobacteria bacterium]